MRISTDRKAPFFNGFSLRPRAIQDPLDIRRFWQPLPSAPSPTSTRPKSLSSQRLQVIWGQRCQLISELPVLVLDRFAARSLLAVIRLLADFSLVFPALLFFHVEAECIVELPRELYLARELQRWIVGEDVGRPAQLGDPVSALVDFLKSREP